MIFGRVKVKSGMSARFEELIAEMIRETAHEPACTRYEYWRMSEPDTYFLMECFTDVNAFFVHAAAPYHERISQATKDECIESLHWEWVDFMGGSHTKFPPTSDQPLPADAPADVKKQKELAPVHEASWWMELRRRYRP
jgi:quinol monooxygenase YgiN